MTSQRIWFFNLEKMSLIKVLTWSHIMTLLKFLSQLDLSIKIWKDKFIILQVLLLLLLLVFSWLFSFVLSLTWEKWSRKITQRKHCKKLSLNIKIFKYNLVNDQFYWKFMMYQKIIQITLCFDSFSEFFPLFHQDFLFYHLLLSLMSMVVRNCFQFFR